jgi:putative transposase
VAPGVAHPEELVPKHKSHHATGLYAHITWHTWRWLRSITEQDVAVIKQAAIAAAQRTRVRIHAMEVLNDHLHVVMSYAPDATVSAFICEAKSESARRVNLRSKPGRLRWCRGCYANSLSWSHVRAARLYVGRQLSHHPDRLPLRVG